MFALAYVILPFSETAPADAIQSSLARFQRGLRGDVPDSWIQFEDCTEFLRSAHEAKFVFTLTGTGGLSIQGGNDVDWFIDFDKVQDEMRRRELNSWSVRFADTMDIETFHDRFCRQQDRNPETGGFGTNRNSLGRWDWWDLGGRFDGHIVGDARRAEGRGVAKVRSPGKSRGRTILGNLDRVLGAALGQEPAAVFDIRSDRNIELVATLLAAGRAGEGHAIPGALVLPPGNVEDDMRWLDYWPETGPAKGIASLGLPADAPWSEVVLAAYRNSKIIGRLGYLTTSNSESEGRSAGVSGAEPLPCRVGDFGCGSRGRLSGRFQASLTAGATERGTRSPSYICCFSAF